MSPESPELSTKDVEDKGVHVDKGAVPVPPNELDQGMPKYHKIWIQFLPRRTLTLQLISVAEIPLIPQPINDETVELKKRLKRQAFRPSRWRKKFNRDTFFYNRNG